MLIVTALAGLSGLMTRGWRMAAGVLLGSALCLFNLRWLKASTGAILAPAVRTQDGRVPRWTASKFILRWFVLVAVASLAVLSGGFDLLGIAVGLATFVGAVMIEATYQAYLTFKE
jgi:hypothetical protein